MQMQGQSLGFRQANKCKCKENDKKLYMLQMQMQQNVNFLVCTNVQCTTELYVTLAH